MTPNGTKMSCGAAMARDVQSTAPDGAEPLAPSQVRRLARI